MVKWDQLTLNTFHVHCIICRREPVIFLLSGWTLRTCLHRVYRLLLSKKTKFFLILPPTLKMLFHWIKGKLGHFCAFPCGKVATSIVENLYYEKAANFSPKKYKCALRVICAMEDSTLCGFTLETERGKGGVFILTPHIRSQNSLWRKINSPFFLFCEKNLTHQTIKKRS